MSEPSGQGEVECPGLARVRGGYLRALGLVFCVAFASLLPQVSALLGPEGLSPASEWLGWARESLGGAERWLRLPTWLWLTGASASALQGVLLAGFACGAALTLGLAPRAALVGAWSCYLSITVVGGPFLSFQWDVLLLETALVSLPLAGGRGASSRGPVLLVRFLLFRLMWMSGLVKLASGDATWRDFSAMEYHYWTQPLPDVAAYFAHQLPAVVQRASTAGMFLLELVVPFLLFGPRRARLAAALLLALLQVGILVTGSYGFFNLLTLVLCIAALDDGALQWLRAPRLRRPPVAGGLGAPVPGGSTEPPPGAALASPPVEGSGMPSSRESVSGAPSASPPEPGGRLLPANRWRLPGGGGAFSRPWARRVAFALLAVSYGVLAVTLDVGRLTGWRPPAPIAAVEEAIAPFRSINTYGLFAVMTTRREEVVIEGSDDGQVWREYLLRWRPGRVDEAPRYVAPHMPRLDWQMWFAALSSCRDNPWLLRLQDGLLRGEPSLRGFFQADSLPDLAPRFVRTVRYAYRFTDLATLRATGDWWSRREVGAYCPPLTLRDGRLMRADLPSSP
ncbi:lipase maturation factor family protein [Myxococcus sp. K15C18031901]|uniref:lipase maturation factor family protein n=1 Tax=Myxococcus dinghuensis TaxID=2906761 RepID=UPI0020A7351C|nr:lipase maturation factor family protein [Myxococcus dinghuensis]MCP3098710.1 lipase maturation factor family protein [Myxococcus dinghuensis]